MLRTVWSARWVTCIVADVAVSGLAPHDPTQARGSCPWAAAATCSGVAAAICAGAAAARKAAEDAAAARNLRERRTRREITMGIALLTAQSPSRERRRRRIARMRPAGQLASL